MQKQNPTDKLKDLDLQYQKRLEQWQVVKDKIISSSEKLGLASYSIPKQQSDDEIEFNIFGTRCFLKFKHNFECGYIEYGVISPTGVLNEYRKVTVTTLIFDQSGNLKYKEHNIELEHNIEQMDDAHILVISKIHEELVNKYYYGEQK